MEHDSGLITALIFERPMCLACIAAKTRLSVQATTTAIAVIQRVLNLNRQDAAVCDGCGHTAVVFSVVRPSR
jgi:hypothetical protein